jgi:hypothetical protein
MDFGNEKSTEMDGSLKSMPGSADWQLLVRETGNQMQF